MPEQPSSNPRYLKQIDALHTAGYEKIGDTDVYTNGTFYILCTSTGQIEVYLDFDSLSLKRHGKIMAIHRIASSESGDFELLNLHENNGSPIAAYLNIDGGSGGKYPDDEKALRKKCDKPVEEQLLEAGFQEDSSLSCGNSKVFRAVIEEIKGMKTPKVIAITHDSELKNLLKSPYSDKMITPETEFIGAGERQISNHILPTLQLQDDTMTFDLSGESGSGIIIQQSIKLLRELSHKELGIDSLLVIANDNIFEIGSKNDDLFKIGSINNNDIIRGLTSINGKSIADLESAMRTPNPYSKEVFLGKDESLIDVMIEDNSYVLSHGVTHQNLAEPILYVRALYRTYYLGCRNPIEFTYKKERYLMHVTQDMESHQNSSKNSPNKCTDICVTNLSSGKSMRFSFLLPDMIQRYGFYGGQGTSSRLDPKDIIEVFEPSLDIKMEK